MNNLLEFLAASPSRFHAVENFRKELEAAGYTRLTQALLHAQGIPALYVSGVSTNGITDTRGNAGHAWNMAFVDGRWVIIDSTWGRASADDPATGELKDGGGVVNEQWFDPKELFFSQSHTAQSTFSAVCANSSYISVHS